MGTQRKEKEIKGIFIIVTALFLVFLMIPILRLLLKSFEGQARGVSLGNYVEVLTSHGFMSAFGHSLIISSASAIITTLLAFCLHIQLIIQIFQKRIKDSFERRL